MTAARSTRRRGRLLAAMWIGLVLTVIAAVYPFVDRTTTHALADHIQAGYPSYGAGEIDTAVTAYLVILSVVGGLGFIGWLGTLWAAKAGKKWTRWAATGVFAVALCIALAGLTVADTSGDVGLAPAIGWLQMLPCVPGLLAVVMLWERRQ
ncbi:hypothetical protein OG589_15750 [Sphaerisporangium sp. NBC_01403]|uniref:hypothetical protein n=1 Tax=Sphaerisporangium sp. NBC_01403 TaxID=2903599 RepID=UPI003248304C